MFEAAWRRVGIAPIGADDDSVLTRFQGLAPLAIVFRPYGTDQLDPRGWCLTRKPAA
jgi:hypothetical protein